MLKRLCQSVLSWIISASLCTSLNGCKPARPSDVPDDATWISGGKTDWWAKCSYDRNQGLDKCQTFNAGGRIIEDETYLPYDGGKPAPPSELVIDPSARLAGPYIICLKNGRILLPKSDFVSQKKFVDDELNRH